jgi:hypothetical protein
VNRDVSSYILDRSGSASCSRTEAGAARISPELIAAFGILLTIQPNGLQLAQPRRGTHMKTDEPLSPAMLPACSPGGAAAELTSVGQVYLRANPLLLEKRCPSTPNRDWRVHLGVPYGVNFLYVTSTGSSPA